MEYLEGLPKDFTDAADWALVVKNGEKKKKQLERIDLLPFHSQFLRAISPVMAGLAGTTPVEGSQFAVEIPFEGDLSTAQAFLKWLYRQRIELTLPLAKALAKLSHLWNVPGTAVGGGLCLRPFTFRVIVIV